MCICSRKSSVTKCDGLGETGRSRCVYDNERVTRSFFETLFVGIVRDRLLSQPLIKGSNDNMSHGEFLENVIDFSLGSAEQELTFRYIEERHDALNAVPRRGQ